jgi:DNA-binding NarL/FixJ family response regulator
MTAVQMRALVVEDDRSWQQILCEILTDAGLVVDVVDSVDAVVSSLHRAQYRLAVVDLALGNGDYDNQDGLRVLEAIRLQDPGCVTVMLTGFATVELAVRTLTEYGAFTCLRKESFSRVEFRSLIGQALASAPAGGTLVLSPSGGPADDTTVDADKAALGAGLSPGLVLVIEDDAGWRSILSELLTDAGYEVCVCNDYGEALGALRRERFVLAVVDLSLSSSTTVAGLEAGGTAGVHLEGYRLLSSTVDAGIPTIVVSGVATPDEIDRAYAERGVFACLSKQAFDRRAFLDAVAGALAAASIRDELDTLTRREREVLGRIAQGMTNKEIATALVITTNTVKRHLKAIFSKLDVHTRSAAAAKAIGAGLSVGRSVPRSAGPDDLAIEDSVTC